MNQVEYLFCAILPSHIDCVQIDLLVGKIEYSCVFWARGPMGCVLGMVLDPGRNATRMPHIQLGVGICDTDCGR